MGTRTAVKTAEQERTLILLLLIQMFWSRQNGYEVDLEDFHSAVDHLIILLERIWIGITSKFNLTRTKNGKAYIEVNHFLEYAKSLKLIKIEGKPGSEMIVIHPNAGRWIHKIVTDLGFNLDYVSAVRTQCASTVEWWSKILDAGSCD